jgi:hypothetical protein
MRIHQIFPEEFPEAWVSDWGEDEYGIFMGFTYKRVRQDFRWIEPGSFLMGSPADEPERYDDETQHAVTLSRGFWLADTCVTQALWEAVMGANPSEFKGANHPVENVSWEDAQAFITRMNEMKGALRLCLPSEAQWEYACRSGTSTPFSFGEGITPEIVNYDGNYPYHNGSKGEYRKQTVEVGSLPPPMPGVCPRCTAMSGSGARIGIATIRRRHRTTRKGPGRALTVCCAAARGSTTAGTVVKYIACFNKDS